MIFTMDTARGQFDAGMGMGWQGRGQDTGTDKVAGAGERRGKAAYVRCLGADGAAAGVEECGSSSGTQKCNITGRERTHRGFLFFLMTSEHVL